MTSFTINNNRGVNYLQTPFVIMETVESLSNEHFFTMEVSIPWEEWIENGVCGAKIFNLSVCSFFTTDAYSVELLSALKRKTGKAVGNVCLKKLGKCFC